MSSSPSESPNEPFAGVIARAAFLLRDAATEYEKPNGTLPFGARLKACAEALEAGWSRSSGSPSATDHEVFSLAIEIQNVRLDFARQCAELDSARAELRPEDRINEAAENERIKHSHADTLRAVFARYPALSPPPVETTPAKCAHCTDGVLPHVIGDFIRCCDQCEAGRELIALGQLGPTGSLFPSAAPPLSDPPKAEEQK